MSGLEPKYGTVQFVNRLKFFSREEGGKLSQTYWKYPFLDIFPNQENKTELFAMDNNKYIMNVSDVFPLILTPFWDLMLPAPRRPVNALRKHRYDLSKCCSNSRDHKAEIALKNKAVIRCERNQGSVPYEIQLLNGTILVILGL